MSLAGTYDDANIFAKILRGEVPCVKITEDEHTLAFMDAFPQARGHCLVISKTSTARNILEMEPEALNQVMAQVQRVAAAVVKGLNPDGFVVTQYNGSPAGQTVFHLHVHIIPRWEDVPLGKHAGNKGDVEELTALAAKIAAELA
jgi:histidine triad (HIT) family protein